MKIEKLQHGMTVYDVGRQRMGNTTRTTVAVWPVYIVSIDLATKAVVARWNGNQERTYWYKDWSKWRLNKPILVRAAIGSRLATREEIATAKAQE